MNTIDKLTEALRLAEIYIQDAVAELERINAPDVLRHARGHLKTVREVLAAHMEPVGYINEMGEPVLLPENRKWMSPDKDYHFALRKAKEFHGNSLLYRASSRQAPQAAVPEGLRDPATTITREQHLALREAFEIEAEEGFVDARPSFNTTYARNLFNAGYVRGFDKGTELASRATGEQQ